jgi:hypothetical protein
VYSPVIFILMTFVLSWGRLAFGERQRSSDYYASIEFWLRTPPQESVRLPPATKNVAASGMNSQSWTNKLSQLAGRSAIVERDQKGNLRTRFSNVARTRQTDVKNRSDMALRITF